MKHFYWGNFDKWIKFHGVGCYAITLTADKLHASLGEAAAWGFGLGLLWEFGVDYLYARWLRPLPYDTLWKKHKKYIVQTLDKYFDPAGASGLDIAYCAFGVLVASGLIHLTGG